MDIFLELQRHDAAASSHGWNFVSGLNFDNVSVTIQRNSYTLDLVLSRDLSSSLQRLTNSRRILRSFHERMDSDRPNPKGLALSDAHLRVGFLKPFPKRERSSLVVVPPLLQV